MDQDKEKIKCSVGIIVFNREASLRATLESVKDFAEIIICDGGSTDGTLKIAREYGCKIISQAQEHKRSDNSIDNFSGVRNQTLGVSHYDWFLYVDSDEFLSTEVVTEIRSIIAKETPEYWVYNMPRKFIVNGKKVDCAITYPSYQTRFFNKRAVTGFTRKVHERIQVKDGFVKGFLLACTWAPLDFGELKKKNDYYLTIEENRDITFYNWLVFILFKTVASSALSILRYLKMLLFCRGNKMPWYNEYIRHRYNLKLIFVTGKKFLSIRQRND